MSTRGRPREGNSDAATGRWRRTQFRAGSSARFFRRARTRPIRPASAERTPAACRFAPAAAFRPSGSYARRSGSRRFRSSRSPGSTMTDLRSGRETPSPVAPGAAPTPRAAPAPAAVPRRSPRSSPRESDGARETTARGTGGTASGSQLNHSPDTPVVASPTPLAGATGRPGGDGHRPGRHGALSAPSGRARSLERLRGGCAGERGHQPVLLGSQLLAEKGREAGREVGLSAAGQKGSDRGGKLGAGLEPPVGIDLQGAHQDGRQRIGKGGDAGAMFVGRPGRRSGQQIVERVPLINGLSGRGVE